MASASKFPGKTAAEKRASNKQKGMHCLAAGIQIDSTKHFLSPYRPSS